MVTPTSDASEESNWWWLGVRESEPFPRKKCGWLREKSDDLFSSRIRQKRVRGIHDTTLPNVREDVLFPDPTIYS